MSRIISGRRAGLTFPLSLGFGEVGGGVTGDTAAGAENCAWRGTGCGTLNRTNQMRPPARKAASTLMMRSFMARVPSPVIANRSANVDLSQLPDLLDQLGQVTANRGGSAVQADVGEEQLLAIELDAVRDADVADAAPASPSRGPGNGILRAETGGLFQAQNAGEQSEFGSQTTLRLTNPPELRGFLSTRKPPRFGDQTDGHRSLASLQNEAARRGFRARNDLSQRMSKSKPKALSTVPSTASGSAPMSNSSSSRPSSRATS